MDKKKYPLFEELDDESRNQWLTKWNLMKIEDTKRFEDEYIDQKIYDWNRYAKDWNFIFEHGRKPKWNERY